MNMFKKNTIAVAKVIILSSIVVWVMTQKWFWDGIVAILDLLDRI